MLSEKERDGCVRFLQEFPQHELLSLLETVTGRMITVQREQEAINAIILHSESAQELLRRRKVKKEYIFAHLAAQKVGVLSSANKETLVEQLLQFWGTPVSGRHRLHHLDETVEAVRTTSDCHNQSIGHPPTAGSTIKQNVQVLAEQFTSWFYQQLNSLNQVAADQTTSQWGPQHFWNDSKLRLRVTSLERREEKFQGAELIAERFKSFVCDEGLIFNPNISPEGTRGMNDPHGLVKVTVCGTIHRGHECIGLFEKQFGLIRDPQKENNWKIKYVDVNMKQAAVQQMPTLKASMDRPLAVT